MSHKLHSLKLVPASPASWATFPNVQDLKKIISSAVLADSEITDTALGFYKPPKRVRNMRISVAAQDQIQLMWHGHRKSGAKSPPFIPLKYFVTAFGQNPPDTWVDVEIFPGLENWGV
jgi:hypothetical protein